ncbi:retrovirus-related pol polyprotein from transposon 297 [Plakobranchus ocellatus]|uniref:Retrovirus-related pol polyprotein from transposon 297 n=1 Tax=Plakobranchus ocellatus TaxID=259542 RepID=A0AAV3ZU07_9GAST|nr:retrovirus-related pol polyprotein from transposon 297 [Plakobranchus ocellatus]
MQWKGPFEIVATVGINDYRINMGGKEKTFHDNLLKGTSPVTKTPAKQLRMYSVDRGTLHRADVINSCVSTPVLSALLREIEDLGIIRKSSSPYASPVVVVKRKDVTNRVCIDYRRLNKLTIFDPQPGTPPAGIFQGMEKDQYFSKIDLSTEGGHSKDGVCDDELSLRVSKDAIRDDEFRGHADSCCEEAAVWNGQRGGLY